MHKPHMHAGSSWAAKPVFQSVYCVFFLSGVRKAKEKKLEKKGRELAGGTKCWPVESPMMIEAKLTLERSETVWV